MLGILGGHCSHWSPGPALPPGIQKNLAGGKPLPPGIAKKLDGRLLGQRPHYDGYEWMQAGVDLILVAVATGIIYEVVNCSSVPERSGQWRRQLDRVRF